MQALQPSQIPNNIYDYGIMQKRRVCEVRPFENVVWSDMRYRRPCGAHGREHGQCHSPQARNDGRYYNLCK